MTIEINWQHKAEKLWILLDDISTASDMFKPSDVNSYKAFYEYTMKKCEERGNYMNSLDGHTLTAVEQEDHDKQINEKFRLLDEFNTANSQKLKSIILHEVKDLSEEDKGKVYFKWNHLVSQEINMWIRINKLVTDEEFDHMCEARGFSKSMANYLKSALYFVSLKGNN